MIYNVFMRRRIRYSKSSLLILVIHRLHFWMQLRLGLDLSKHWSCLGTIWIDHCYDFGQYNHVHIHNQIRMHMLQQYKLSQTFWNSETLVHHGRSSYIGNSLTYLVNLVIDLNSAQKMIDGSSKKKLEINSFVSFPRICRRCVCDWTCEISDEIRIESSYNVIRTRTEAFVIPTAPIQLVLNYLICIFSHIRYVILQSSIEGFAAGFNFLATKSRTN